MRATMTVFMQKVVTCEPGGLAPVGTIVSYLGTDVPDKALRCDGSAHKRRLFHPEFAEMMREHTSWWRWHLLRQFRTPVFSTTVGMDLVDTTPRDGAATKAYVDSFFDFTDRPEPLPFQKAWYEQFSIPPWEDPLVYWDGKDYKHKRTNIWGTGKTVVLPGTLEANSGPHEPKIHKDEVELFPPGLYYEEPAVEQRDELDRTLMIPRRDARYNKKQAKKLLRDRFKRWYGR